MVVFLVVASAILSVHSQTVFYVTSKGSDSSTCGSQNDPCATIDQVLTNYPGSSCTVSIGTGAYSPTQIILERDAFIIFQGTGNPSIVPNSSLWKSGTFITNTDTSGFEFHDVSITLSGSGDDFTTLNSGTNVVGFYNVNLTYYNSRYMGTFVSLNGGSVVISNVTFTNAIFDGYFVVDRSNNDDSKIIISGSSFTNLSVRGDGGFLVFQGYGGANIVINGSTFTGMRSDFLFIYFQAFDLNQFVNITNNVFNNADADRTPPIYIQNGGNSWTYVDNTTWSNCTSNFVCGALEVLGTDDYDYNVTLTNLKFSDCHGPYAGALFVGYNSFDLFNSSFSANSGKYGSDVVQDVGRSTSKWTYNIVNSYSSSSLPKAAIWEELLNKVIDISDQLPDPRSGGETISILHFLHKTISASVMSDFSRIFRKNTKLRER